MESKWKPRAIGVLTLGGSATGLAVMAAQGLGAAAGGLTLAIVAAMCAVFTYGMVVGVLILERNEKSFLLALPFWIAQIPVFESPLLSYALFTGAKFDIVLRADHTVNLEWAGGAHFALLLNSSNGWAVGVNVVAIVVGFMVWDLHVATTSCTNSDAVRD